MILTLTLNGEAVETAVEARETLVDCVRRLGFTGSHVGCEQGVCGACSLRLDGRVVRGCLVLAAQAGGKSVETIEGATESGELKDLQEAFHRHNALQCGFCTPGMLLTAAELLAETPNTTRRAIRDYLSGNYCRCTGYQSIIDAVEDAAIQRREQRDD